jgi:hypothetical protein
LPKSHLYKEEKCSLYALSKNSCWEKSMKIGPKVAELEFSNAIQAQNLDSSELILLVTRLMESKLKSGPNQELQEKLKEIKNLHIQSQSAGAIASILEYCDKNPSVIPTNLTKMIKEKASKLNDNPNEDHNRRFFETRFAEHLETEIAKSESYKSVEKLATVMKKMKSSLNIPTTMNSANDAELVLSRVCQFNDNIEMGLKGGSTHYPKKDRAEKFDDKKRDVLSRNPGIMKSTSPNFADLVASSDIKNKVVDRFKVDSFKAEGYSKQHKEVPFVNSISGTAFTLSALLSEHINANKGDPNLQKDVNNIAMSFISVYIKKGYHSLGEMMDVLQEPHIVKMFEANGVKLDFKFPDAVMEKTYQEAQAYTNATCQKKASQDQIIQGKVALAHVPMPEPKMAENVRVELGKVVDNPKKSAVSPAQVSPIAKENKQDAQQQNPDAQLYEAIIKIGKPAELKPGVSYLAFQNSSDQVKNKADRDRVHQMIVQRFGDSASRVSQHPSIASIQITPAVVEFMKQQELAKKVVITPQEAKSMELPPDLEALGALAKMKEVKKAEPVSMMFNKQSAISSGTLLAQVKDNDEKLNAALNKGEAKEYPGREGRKYFVFQNEVDKTAAIAMLTEKFGKDACQSSRQDRTLELLSEPAKAFGEQLKQAKIVTPQKDDKTKIGLK